MSGIETELRCRSCGQPVGSFHHNPCEYGNVASPYVVETQCAKIRRSVGMGENWSPEKRGRALAFVQIMARSHHTEWKSKAQIWAALQEFKD